MKSLFQYLEECGEAATPANTMGIGDPVADDGDGKGTEPLTAKVKKEKPIHKRKKKPSEEE